jgi:hypothetical protein
VATHLTHQATYRDPCTPRGFSRMGGEVKLPASILESKAEYSPFAHAAGNFTECRSAVRTILQKGQGKYHSYTSSLSYFLYISNTRGHMFYSRRPLLLVANMDVCRHILVSRYIHVRDK